MLLILNKIGWISAQPAILSVSLQSELINTERRMGTGRNEPCPCGSGKKYKKCCIDRPQPSQAAVKPQPETVKHPVFSAVNTTDLLQTFAALTVLPENHGKNYRLEQLTQLALENRNDAAVPITFAALERVLGKEFASSSFEEQPINFFTELITNGTGDNLIFPGITETIAFSLSNLLAAVFHWPDSGIPADFNHNVESVTLLLMAISDRIATRLDYERYMPGEAEDDAIFIPETEDLAEAKAAVTFSELEMTALRNKLRVPKEALDLFLADPSAPPSDYDGEPAFINKPVLKIGEQYIVISPTTISKALMDFIWQEADSWGIMPQVNKAYHDVLWNNLNMELELLKFKHIELKGAFTKGLVGLRAAFLKLDEDKIALLQMLYDDGKDMANPAGAHIGFQRAHELRQAAINHMRAIPEYKDYQILELVVVSPIGRHFGFPYLHTEHARSLSLFVNDIHTLFETKDTVALDLWNFAGAAEELIAKVKKLRLRYIDLFKIYEDHRDSLNLTEEELAMLPLQLGVFEELISEATWRVDPHSATTFVNGHISHIPVRRNGRYGPVYIAPGEMAHNLIFYVEAFSFPVSVSPVRERAAIPRGLKDIFWQVNDAIAYWLWQVSQEILPYLESLPNIPLQFRFDVAPEEAFLNMVRDYERKPDLFSKFKVSADKGSVTIILPPELIPYLYGADNEGERVLLKVMLRGFNLVLALHGLPEMTGPQMDEAVNAGAPLGPKKKFFIFDSADNILLDPKDLVPYRYVQEYELNKVKDLIVPALGKLCPPPGEVKDPKEKSKLARNIVMRVLLPRLKELLAQYDSTALLKKLIGINETLIRKREKLNLMTPTRIACFVSEEQQQADLVDNLGELNATIVAIRCLIEHITAEPYTGSAIISATAIDELVACMDQVIRWGGLGDQLQFELFDVPLTVTDRRVVAGSKELDEVLSPYNWTKMGEHIVDAKSAFEHTFPQTNPIKGKDVPPNVDQAFVTDFGISFTRICGMINALGIIAYRQPLPYAMLAKSSLKAEINKIEAPFSDAEFESGFQLLALFNRGKVENFSAEFEGYDISPWRYNRRLSLMRRPLSVVNNPASPDDPFVYWGVRQVIASRSYLADQCRSNRLRVREDGAIIKVLSKLNNEAGARLVLSVIEQLKNPDLVTDSEIFIGPDKPFKNPEDIGDIDVLLIDVKNKVIYSLECKNMAASRSFKEMVEEVGKLFDERWIDKHVVRDQWIKDNLDQLNARYKLDLHDFAVKSIFVTAEEMLTPYLKDRPLPIPFVTLYALREKGMAAIT